MRARKGRGRARALSVHGLNRGLCGGKGGWEVGESSAGSAPFLFHMLRAPILPHVPSGGTLSTRRRRSYFQQISDTHIHTERARSYIYRQICNCLPHCCFHHPHQLDSFSCVACHVTTAFSQVIHCASALLPRLCLPPLLLLLILPCRQRSHKHQGFTTKFQHCS